MKELIGMKFFITLALLNVFQKCFYREISLPDFNLNVKSFIEHVPFLIDKIKKELDNLNPYKSPRADELHPRILKELSNELSLPLSLVISKLFSEKELPQNWKDAIIIPLHKKGEKKFASNYRPISLTSTVPKVMESIIQDDILSSRIVTQVKKANRMTGLIRRSYTHLDRTFFRCLFNPLVRPHLEYCVSIWCQILKKDEKLIENVLRRATKLISGLYDKLHKERMAANKVSSMRYCRMWVDMILVYKILRGDNQTLRDLFTINKIQDKRP